VSRRIRPSASRRSDFSGRAAIPSSSARTSQRAHRLVVDSLAEAVPVLLEVEEGLTRDQAVVEVEVVAHPSQAAGAEEDMRP
jgi:hypothetical protein